MEMLLRDGFRPEFPESQEAFMAKALQEAHRAGQEEEVPIGAVLVSQSGAVLASAYNLTRQLQDPTAHAEILVLRKAAQAVNNFRLTGTILYVTIEPCLMCAGAIVQARVDTVVYGAADYKAGAFGSLYDLSKDNRLNHRVSLVTGVKEPECRELIQAFFRKRRKTAGLELEGTKTKELSIA